MMEHGSKPVDGVVVSLKGNEGNPEEDLDQRLGEEARVAFRVRYAETDQMGFVHHSVYFTWFEAARTELFRRWGFPYTGLEEKGVYSPVVECNAAYLAPARYDEEIVVTARLEGMSAAKLTFGYKVEREGDGELLATGQTVHAFINRQGKPRPIRKVLPGLWERLCR